MVRYDLTLGCHMGDFGQINKKIDKPIELLYTTSWVGK